MGGSWSSNIATVQQKFLTNVTQASKQTCIATVNATANNNVVIINGASIKGNFTGVTSTTSTDATCTIVSSMDNSVSNILSATTDQKNKATSDMFGDFSWNGLTNAVNVGQSVVNNISQINQAACNSQNTSSTSNNYVYVTNASIGGDFIGVSNTANASASCNMSNLMKNVVYNQAQASVSQGNTYQGMFASIVGAIASVIVIVVIAVIIMFSIGSIGYIGYSKKKPPNNQDTTEQNQESQDNQELNAIQSLGLPPDVLNNLANNPTATSFADGVVSNGLSPSEIHS